MYEEYTSGRRVKDFSGKLLKCQLRSDICCINILTLGLQSLFMVECKCEVQVQVQVQVVGNMGVMFVQATFGDIKNTHETKSERQMTNHTLTHVFNGELIKRPHEQKTKP